MVMTMRYSGRTKEKYMFAALTVDNNVVLGNVLKITDSELTFSAFTNNEIDRNASQHLAVFERGKIYFRHLPVEIVSDNQFINHKSFTKFLAREITVKFKNPTMTNEKYIIRGRVVEVKRRIIFTEGFLLDRDERIMASAKGKLFTVE